MKDARLWKTFRTVIGVNTDKNKPENPQQISLGDPAVVFILNKKDDHTYDSYQFGAANQTPTSGFTDDAGRLPDWTHGVNTPTDGHFTAKKGQWIPAASVLYQNGQWVRDNFKGTPRCNMFAHINKTTCGDGAKDQADDSYRDVTMTRSAETYLMRAELYVRSGDYANAMNDLNTIRRRAQWKSGENRSYYIDGSQAAYTMAVDKEKVDNTLLTINSYYLSNPEQPWTTEASDLTLKSFPENLPEEDEAVMNKLGVSDKYDRALHFILNERTRELIGEWQRWETLSRTGTLVKRAKAFNPDATGIQENKHELRPIPQTFLDQLRNTDGSNLTSDQKSAWQNAGY